MLLETNFIDLDKKINTYSLNAQKHITESMKRLGFEAEFDAKDTINTFVNSKGNQQGVHSGLFRDGVHSDVIEGGYGFVLKDAVDYGIHHEFGTEAHWVPFFDKNTGEITSLGKWAMKHFDVKDDSTFRVIGKRGKALKKPSLKSREEVLRGMGGVVIKLDEMAPFRKALEHVQRISPKIFQEEFAK